MTVELEGLNMAGLSESNQQALKRAYAAKIAETCGLPSSSSVWNLFGDNGTITVSDGTIEGFVAVPQGSYANSLARALYAPAFKEQMMQATADVPGAPQASAVGPVVLKLERFERQVITATLTTTTSTVTTITTTETTTEEATVQTSQVHHDVVGTAAPGALRGKNSANRGLSLRWCELLLVAFVVASMA